MCSPTQETHITRDMCFPAGGTHIPSDICFPTFNTHMLSDMYSPTEETHSPDLDFLKKQKKEKWPSLDQNHGLTPLVKC